MTDPTPNDNGAPTVLGLFAQAVVISMRQLALTVVNPFREAYRLAGAPYGDTDAGLDRWMDELRAGLREKAEADYQRLREWVVEDMRRQLEERRDSPP